MTGRGPRRKIIGVEFTRTKYNRIGEGNVKLTLDCGHFTFRKRSKHRAGQTYANCFECWKDQFLEVISGN